MKTSLSLKMAETVSEDVMNSKEGCFVCEWAKPHSSRTLPQSITAARHFQVDPTGWTGAFPPPSFDSIHLLQRIVFAFLQGEWHLGVFANDLEPQEHPAVRKPWESSVPFLGPWNARHRHLLLRHLRANVLLRDPAWHLNCLVTYCEGA